MRLGFHEPLDDILNYPHEITDGTGQASRVLRGEIVIKDLSFTYPGQEEPVLGGIHSYLIRGRSLGIIGNMGSATTTLVNLLLKSYPVPDGKINIGGDDINDYPLGVLLDSVG